MITLYTLPNCGICHMIKTKLEQKGIKFEERDFAEAAEDMGLTQAPLLRVIHSDTTEYIMSPKKMVDWINQQ